MLRARDFHFPCKPGRNIFQEASHLLDLINQARGSAGVPALLTDGDLDDVAADAARQASKGSLDGVSRAALDEAKRRGLLTGRLRAWAATTPEIARLKLPGTLRKASVRRLGFGVAQAKDANGTIGVVLLLAE